MVNYSYDEAPWYSGRDSITIVNIENGVTTIGNHAFYDCTSLTSVTIPDSVTSIGYRAFYYCTSLTQITFRGDALSIGSYAFLYVTTTAYYPANNPTWTSDKLQNYGGTITWVPYNATECDHQWELIETDEPSCLESGNEMYCCALCGDWDNVYLQPLGHD